MKKNNASQRGFSIAEVLTVCVICSILLTSMVLMVPAVVRAPRQIQSQVDDVNTAAIALYKIRRDFSQSDTLGVMGCSYAPVVSCTTYNNPTNVSALVVASADNGSGQFMVNTVKPNNGYPLWQGVVVYWLVPNADKTAFDIMRAYEPVGSIPYGPNGAPALAVATAQAAVTAAIAISPPPVLANYIKTISVGVDSATNIVSFTLVAGTTSGNSLSSTTFASNTYARN